MGDRIGLVRLYHRTCELVAVAIIPAGLTLALFAEDFIQAWTGSAVTAQRSGLVASLLLADQLLQAITVVPYYLTLAYGNIRLNLQTVIASVVLITPCLIYLTIRYGIVGAGLSWLIMNICTLPFYMYLLHRRFLPGELGQWCLRSLARPLLAALPCVVLGRWLMPHFDSRWLTLCLIGLIWSVAASATAAFVPELRNPFMKQFCRFIGVCRGTT